MIDVRLAATNPEDSTLVPVSCNARGELNTVAPKIEEIPNDLQIDGDLTVTGLINGSDGVGEQGPQGEQGEQGDPGPNVLLPYGPELSYLAIQNGVPTWVFGGGGGDGPGPTEEITLLDNREALVDTCDTYGMFNAIEYPVLPGNTWDEYTRSLPTWDTPAPQKTGIGGTGNKEEGIIFPFSLILMGGFDKLLQISVAYRHNQPNYAGSYNWRVLKLTPDNDNLLAIDDGIREDKFEGGDYNDVHTCVFLPQRPDLGQVNFEVRCKVPKVKQDTGNVHAFIQRWEYVDASKYLLNRMLKAKDKLITATDIDFSRLIKD